MYRSSQRDSITPIPMRPYSKLMKNDSEVGPRYTSPSKLSSVKELLKERRDLHHDDSSKYVYTSTRSVKPGLAQILERKRRQHKKVLQPNLDEMNDSLMQSIQSSVEHVYVHQAASITTQPRAKSVTPIAGQTTKREPTPELVEPKLLREIREARHQEELAEKQRKMQTMPLKYHMTKAMFKLKKAGAVEQERAKYSGNNFERLKMELKNNRDGYGTRKAPEMDEVQEARLEDLHRSEKLKQSKLDKRAKDDGTGTFVPYITAKMMEHAERQASTKTNQVRLREREEWMKKRKMKGNQQYRENRERVQFAKSIFTTWDTNKNGRLDVNEIAHPMMTLGLSHNFQFVEQVLNSISVNKQRISILNQQPTKRKQTTVLPTREDTLALPTTAQPTEKPTPIHSKAVTPPITGTDRPTGKKCFSQKTSHQLYELAWKETEASRKFKWMKKSMV